MGGLVLIGNKLKIADQNTPKDKILSFAQVRDLVDDEEWMRVAQELLREVANAVEVAEGHILDIRQKHIDEFVKKDYLVFLERLFSNPRELSGMTLPIEVY